MTIFNTPKNSTHRNTSAMCLASLYTTLNEEGVCVCARVCVCVTMDQRGKTATTATLGGSMCKIYLFSSQGIHCSEMLTKIPIQR